MTYDDRPRQYQGRRSTCRVPFCASSAALMACLLPGCFRNAGTGGTGEIVVPEQRLREVATFTPQPATQPTTRPTTVPLAQVELTIEQCRERALHNNLDLRVELLNPTIARQTLSEDQARFEALFVTDASFSTNDDATASQLSNRQSKAMNIAPGVQIPLQTGGTLSLSGDASRFETNNSFSTLNPAYTSDLRASISLPLLRGAGVYYNTQQIRIAFYEYEATQAGTKLEVIRVLTDMEKAYWRLYAARQELIVRQKQRDLAIAQLERARRQVAAQVTPEVEITRAESGVADTVEAILTAENNARDVHRELKRILNDPAFGVESDTIIIPASPPTAIQYGVDGQKLVQAALHDRMELLQAELRIAEAVSSVRVARNDLLPLVTLAYQYRQNGIGKTLNDSFNVVERNHFSDHAVSLHLEVPLGNEAARSRLRGALARRLQQLATREQRQVQIEKEVLDAVDNLQLTWQRILAAQKRVILNARLVDAETRQFQLGLRTSTEVLDAQTKLADAKSSEIRALTDYQIAQVDIAFATGNVLGASRVVWEPAKVK